MALVLICWLYIAFICYAYGFLTLQLFQRLGIENGNKHLPFRLPFSLICLIGLAQVSTLSTVLSLVMNIGALAVGLTTAIAIVIYIFNRKIVGGQFKRIVQEFRATPWYSVVLIALQVILAIKSSSSIYFHYDTGLYHAPAIRWIETYGVTPGLVNLLAPLGVDSIWMQPNALFGFNFLFKYPLHKVIGLTVCWSIYLVLGRAKEFFANGDSYGCGSRRLSFSFMFHVLTLIPLIELCSNLTSPSTDEPAAVFVLLVLVLTAQYIEAQQIEENENSGSRAVLGIAIAIFSAFAIAIKLSAIPILICPIYVIWCTGKERRWLWLALQIGTFAQFLVPKLIRTLILSGYLVYPFPYLDFFNFDWKMPRAYVVEEMDAIRAWARMPNANPQEVLRGGLSFWFPTWLPTFLSSPVAIALIIAISMFLVSLIWRLSVIKLVRQYAPLYVSAIAGIGYWFWAAPFIRFGFGFLWGLILLLMVPPILSILSLPKSLFWQHTYKHLRTNAAIGLVVTLLLIIFYSESGKEVLGSGLKPSQIFTIAAKYYIPDNYAAYSKANADMVLRRACGFDALQPIKGQQCWDADVPCTPFYYGEITVRGMNIKDGFRSIDRCPTSTTFRR